MENTRTTTQNNALHLYFRLLADELNLAGLDMKKVLKPSIDIEWNEETVKEYLWRPIQNAQVLKKSTRQLNTKEIDKIYDTINRHMSEKFGISVPWPSQDPLNY